MTIVKLIRRIFAAFLLGSGFVLCASFASANFNHAMKVLEAGEFEKAQAAFESLASIGNREALYNLGVMHYRGQHFQQDFVHGYALMVLASENHSNTALGESTKKIYALFSEQQKSASRQKISELRPIYGVEAVQKRISPVPLADEDCVPELRPEKWVPPLYPRKEQLNGRMGFTLLEMTVSPRGYPRDIYIDRSSSKAFTKASLKALRKQRYAPPANGQPFYGHRFRFTYVLGSTRGHVDRINTKKLEQSVSAALKSAEEGNASAQFEYARSLGDLKAFDKGLRGMKLEYRDANRWFEKAAKGGLPHAQFELGRNMLDGRGCEQDRENGMRWIKAAAVSGLASAQHLLARETDLLMRNDQNNLAMMSWLRSAVLSDYYPAKVQLAWELSASTTPALRDGEEALSLLDTKPKQYFDGVRILETQAAAHARNGNFSKAVTLQKKAIKKAKTYKWTIPAMQERLGLYEHEEAWVGPYY